MFKAIRKKSMAILMTLAMVLSLIPTVAITAKAAVLATQLLNSTWKTDATNGFSEPTASVDSTNIKYEVDSIWLNSSLTTNEWIEFSANPGEGLDAFDLTSLTLGKYTDPSISFNFTVTGTKKSDSTTVSQGFTWAANDGLTKTFSGASFSSFTQITKFRITLQNVSTEIYNIEFRGLEIANQTSGSTPVISGLSGITYFENDVNANFLQIDSDVSVTDGGSADFNGGQVTVSYSGTPLAEDQLSVGNIGNISVSGNTVSYSGVGQIGTMSGGVNGADLTIALNASATPARTTDMLRAIVYKNMSNEPTSNRTISITVSDGDGFTSAAATAKISVSGQAEAGVENPPSNTQGVNISWVNDLNNGFTIQGNGGVTIDGDGTCVWINGSATASFNVAASEQFAGGKFDLTTLAFDVAGSGTAFTVTIIGHKPDGATVTTSVTGDNSAALATINLSSITGVVSFNFQVTHPTGGSVSNVGLDSFTIANPQSAGAINTAPVISGLSGIAYLENDVNANFLQIDSDVSVADSDSTDFDGGQIKVTYSGTPLAEDQLSVGNIGNISLSGNTVSYSGVGQIGMMSGGANGADLTIALNANATPARTIDLLRAIAYKNSSNEPTSNRTISITVSDGDGGTSSAFTAKISVSGQAEAGVENPPSNTQDLNISWGDDLNNGFIIQGNSGVTLTGDANSVWISSSPSATASFNIAAAEQFAGGMFDLTALAFDVFGTGKTFTVTIIGHKSDGGTVTASVTGDSNAALAAIDLSSITGVVSFDFQVTAPESTSVPYVGLNSFTIANPAAANNPPTVSGLPSDVTVTEDTASNVDLSAAAFSDDENDALTVTLTASAGTFAATSSGGVTVGGTGTGTLTLAGTAAAINIYLDTVSNIKYTGAANANGNDAATFTVHAYDGTANPQLGTVNLDITAVSDDPAVSANTGLTLNEGAGATIDTAKLSISDVDTAATSLTLTVGTAPSHGTLYKSGVALAANGTFTQNDLANNRITYTHDGGETTSDSFTFTVSDGTTTLASTTFSITVAAVNDAPVVTASGGSTSYTENAAAAAVDNATAVTDVDSSTLASGTVVITGNFQSAEDVLAFTNDGSTMGNVTGSYNGTTGVLTMTSDSASATVAQWQAALRAVTYVNTSDDPSSTDRTVSIKVNDGTSDSAAATKTVTITAVNDAPTLSATGTTPAFAEDGSAVDLFSAVSVSTIEAVQTLTGLTVTVSNLANDASEILNADGLSIVLANGNSGTTTNNSMTYSVTVAGSTATVTLSKAAGISSAAMQTLIDGMTYINTSDTPTIGNRVITLTSIQDDGGTASGGVDTTALVIASTVTVAAVNDAPVITAPASISVTEDVAAALTGISFADVDAGGASVTATLSVPSGALAAASDGGVTVGGTSSAMTLTGSMASINAFIAASNVTFTTALNATANVTLTVAIDDDGNIGSGGAKTDTETVVLTVTSANDAPVITAPASISATEDVAAALAGISFVDVDAGGASVMTTLSVPSGALAATSGGGVTVGGTSSAMTLTGSMTNINAFIAAGSVTFTTALNATANVTLTVAIDDGGNNGSGGAKTDTETVTLAVTSVNDAPTLTNLNGDSVSFSIGGGAVALNSGSSATVADVDSSDFNGGNVTVSITVNGQAAEDVLSAGTVGSITVSGATVSYSGMAIGTIAGGSGGNDLVISLNASATPAAVQALVGALTYIDTDSGTVNTLVRTVRVTITDGDGGTSNACDISIVLVRAPILDLETGVVGSGYSGSFTEDGGAVAVTGTTSASDDGTFKSLTVTLTNHPDDALETLSSTYGTGAQTVNGEAVTISAYNSVTGVLSITVNDDSAAAATLQMLMESIRYNNSSNDPDSTSRSIEFAATDNDDNTGSSCTAVITLTAVDDAPVVTASGGSTSYTENTAAAAIDSGVTVSDADTSTLASGTVSITGNFSSSEDALAFSNDGSTMGNISGTYNGTTGVLTMTSAGATATVAQWQAALRAVTYANSSDDPSTLSRTISMTVNDGTSDSVAATKSVSVTAVNDAPNITSGATASFTDGGTGTAYTSTASDPEGSTLTWSITAGADAALFDINSSTGAVIFKIAPSYSAPTDSDTDNIYELTVSVTDGALTDTQAITITVTNAPPSGGGTPVGGTNVEVNGTSYSAGNSEQTTNTQGQSVTTVTVDTEKLEDILEAQGQGAVVTILVTTGSDVAAGVLTGRMVDTMESGGATLVIQTETATYTLPAEEIDINAVSQQFGDDVSLSDITVTVSISEPSDDMVRVVEDTAREGGYTLVVPAVEFSVTCTYGDETVEVSTFNAYVERMIAIPEGADPVRITTAIVVDSEGSEQHVPTKVVVIDGKFYAVINSLSNSVYTVIYNPVEFADAAGHWAKEAINDMGSRLVITGVGGNAFEPDKDITRAEFAAFIIRALGLKAGVGENAFSDVITTEWYCGYVETAAFYDLVTGYSTGTFGPGDKITREQAMTMTARAMAITKLAPALSDSEIKPLLSGFADGADVSGYAAYGVAACLKIGIVAGKGGLIAPQDYITKAEVAVMIQRLLSKSGLI